MASRKKKTQETANFSETLRLEVIGLIMVVMGFIAMNEWGFVGRSLSFFFKLLVGNWHIVLLWGIVLYGLMVMIRRRLNFRVSRRRVGLLLLFTAVLIRHHIQFFGSFAATGSESVLALTWRTLWESRLSPSLAGEGFGLGGGMIGAFLYFFLRFLFDLNGMKLISILMILLGFLLLSGLSYVQIGQLAHQGLRRLVGWMQGRMDRFWQGQLKKHEQKKGLNEERKKVRRDEQPHKEAGLAPEWTTSEPQSEEKPQEAVSASVSQPPLIVDFQAKRLAGTREGGFVEQTPSPAEEKPASAEMAWQTEPHENYRLPSLVLLNRANRNKGKEGSEGVAENARKLEATLESFGVRVKVTQIHRGPAVTRYELQPDVGVKVSRIVSLVDDMALALAAKDLRIEAPVPGKSVIGIEVPNREISVVTLREVLESDAFIKSPSKLTIALGRDISGEPIVAELSKMPHLLVAGATGSGKSVCINGIITSILYKAKPNEVKLLMIDPKMVELSIYNEIPHLLIPVVTDPRKASMALKKVVAEMEQRYERFAEKGTREIERYNQLMEAEDPRRKLPYIVVIIDELADLMMVAPTDVEESISRLAQMARACGIHLLIATQRPSVDVITGLIKANIPSRIAFGVSSQIDSRTILDMAGAEKLLGRGDMLYYPVGAAKPLRVQGAFLSDGEVEAVVDFVKQQQRVTYREDLIPSLPAESEEEDAVERDELYEAAKEMVIDMQQASVSLLQRRLHIGYTRAARLIDALESQGVVGPYEGSKPREVLYKSNTVMTTDSLGS